MGSRSKGFTLVELIVVIVILGILAATALPRFINVQNEARVAAVQGIAGGLRSAAAVANAKWQASGGTGASISMVGAPNVTVTANGFPTNNATGIQLAMQCESGTACQGNVVDLTVTPSTWRPASGGGANCQATYNDGSVAVDVSAC